MNSLANIAALSDGQAHELAKNTSVDRTVKEMQRIAQANAWQMTELAKQLQGNTVNQTGRNIFKWVRQNIRYKKDRSGVEELRSPARTVADRAGDCDCTSILISALLLNMGIPHYFRVVAVKGRDWEHVYTIARDEQGREISLDTVPEIKYYGWEHPYKRKKDFKTMEVTALAGINPGLTDLMGNLVAALRAMPQTEETRMELALAMTVEAALQAEDDEMLTAVLENAIQQSRYLQEAYLEIARAGTELGILPAVVGVAALAKSGATVKVGAAINQGLSLIGGGNNPANIPVLIQPGQVFQDGHGNIISITNDQKDGDFLAVVTRNGSRTSQWHVSEIRIGANGQAYARNRGGARGDSRGPDYIELQTNGVFRSLGRIGDWPAQSIAVSQPAQPTQAIQPAAPVASANQFAEAAERRSGVASQGPATAVPPAPPAPANENWLAKNWWIVAIIAVVLIGGGIVVAQGGNKKRKK